MTGQVPAAGSQAASGSYHQILKASALTGGSTAINIALGIIRTKITAVLLGPAGFGLMSLYSSISEVAVALAGMGINSSGVRQIAEAAGSGQESRVARTTFVLRRTSLVVGVLGMLGVIVFSRQISRTTFGTDVYANGVALLSLAVFFRLVSGGQAALVQGMRRVADLARMRVLGGVFGTVLSVPLVYYFRERGIVPSLVGAAAMTVLTSWWFSRRVRVPSTRLSAGEVRNETVRLLQLGLAFMVSAFLTMGTAYVVRMIVIRKLGLTAAGLYQSAWVLGGLYVGFILQAMGADLYPRLTAISNDHDKCNRLVNEQTSIGLLLAGPGVMATLTFASIVISVFYSAEFAAAADLLRWVCLGMILRVVAFPIGYVVLAKGDQRLFLWNEVSVSLVHVGSAFALVERFGVPGATMAFVLSCLWHCTFIFVVVRRRTGFAWSRDNRRLLLIFLPLTSALFVAFKVLPSAAATVLGLCALGATGAYSLRMLVRLISIERIRRFVPGLPAWSWLR